MRLDEFDSRGFLQNIFDVVKARTAAKLPPNVDFNLRFSPNFRVAMYASNAEAVHGEWRYDIWVTNRMVEYLTRFFFAFARCAPSVNWFEIPDPQPSGVPHALIPDSTIETVEALLNQIADDTEIEGERKQLFEACLTVAWNLLLLHETAHIIEGHLRFKTEQSALFSSHPAFSRSLEYEADEKSVKWSMLRRFLNAPVWMNAGDEINGWSSVAPDFAALVTSMLFLLMRIQTLTNQNGEGENYLPFEIRHRVAIVMFMLHKQWPDPNMIDRAVTHHLVQATRMVDRVVGWPETAEQVIVSDIPFETQKEMVEQVVEEYLELMSAWEAYRFRAPTQTTQPPG